MSRETLTLIRIGADPEKFVVNSEGTVTDAIGKLFGSKSNPFLVAKGAVQEDNVLAEFNIDPADTEDQFLEHLRVVQGEMDDILSDAGLRSIVLSSHEYDISYLQTLGYQALEFGCTAEWSSWTGAQMPKPKGESTGLRTAGGHIHIGYDSPDEETNQRLGQLLDYTMGIPSVIMDSDTRRRELYGKAGSMRHKPYGMEYRVLSNFWLANEGLQRWAYRTAKNSAENIGKLDDYLKTVDPELVIQTINNSDVAMAHEIASALKLEVA